MTESDSEAMVERIREILLSDWDPHDASRQLPEARNAYDTYIPRLMELLRRGAAESEIVEYLYARERESMCFPGLGKERLVRAARKLGALKHAIVGRQGL